MGQSSQAPRNQSSGREVHGGEEGLETLAVVWDMGPREERRSLGLRKQINC